MKICWDTLEGVKLSKKGDFIKSSVSLIYKDSCEICGQSYLTEKRRPSRYCSHDCVYKSKEFKNKLSKANSGSNNNMFGKTHSKNIREKISKHRKGKLTGKHNPNYGGLSNIHKKNISKSKKGKPLSEETKLKMSINRKGQRLGNLNPMWKGGISFEPYCEQWSDKEYKESIKERDGCKCLNPECSKLDKKLCVHHIDYNKKNCHPLNLITTCSSCNSKANKNRNWHKSWYRAIIFRRYLQ